MKERNEKGSAFRADYKYAAAVLLCAAAIVLLLVSLSACYLYYVKETIRKDAKSSLGELGKHIAESLENDIESTNSALESLALRFSRDNFSSEQEMTAFLKEQSDFWGFHDMAYIDREGISRHVDGGKDAMNRSLLSSALKTGETVYDFLVAGGEDCVVFVTPMPPAAREEGEVLALSGTYAVHNWNRLLDIDIFNHRAVAHIVTNTGVVINRSTRQPQQYNLLDSLRGARFERGVTLSGVEGALREGRRLQTVYTLEGAEYYLCHEPIGFRDWALVFTVPAATVNGAGTDMARSVLLIGAGLTVVFLLVFLLFLAFQSRTKKALWRMAYRDEVTGGANKNKFELDAQSLLAAEGRSYLLVYLNICQFKMLNRRLGRQEADRILQSLDRALAGFVTARECCGRLGADHFLLLMEAGGAENRLEAFAREQRWQRTSAGACPVRLVFGLCAARQGVYDLTHLIDQANLAMKTLPPNGESCTAFYDVSMMEQAAREKELTELLTQSKTREEFFICLQPKVDLITGRVTGAEALARWQSPVFGFVPPGEFIPLAERAGSVCQIDWMAFEEVCKVLKGWEDQGKPLVPISFNLSKAQFALPDFLEHYRELIQKYQVPCRYLDFEFTESILYEDTDALREAVSQIHAMGALCSVDDFGFGYSSLGLLGQFEADTLKLDRSFFRVDADAASRSNQIVCNIISLAESLGMGTVAEGIEDWEHVDMLRQFGCGCIQGYIFSRPLTVGDFERFLLKRTERVTAE